MPNKKRQSSESLAKRYKKQNGLHHSKNKNYMKVYWPYLPVILIVVFGIFTSIAIVLHKSSTNVAVISPSNLLNVTNEQRELNNDQPLTLNQSLDQAAQQKANSMVSQNYWSHISPSGQTPWDIILASGYKFQTAGENLAYGFNSGDDVLNAWMASPDHRANVLDSNYSNVGFGVARSNDYQNKGPETVVVAMYASPAGQVSSVSTAQSAISSTSSTPPFTNFSDIQPSSTTIYRIEALTSRYTISAVLICGLIFGVAICYLVIRHGLIIKRWLHEGEELAVNHPYLDIALVVIIIASALLSQSVGFIR